MSNIIDTIQVSGVTYTIQGSGGGTVSSAITSGDTNPVEGGVLYDELRIPSEVESGLTLEWYNYDGGETTNYPSGSGCSKITFEVVASGETEGDEWYQDEGWFSVNDVEGYIHIAMSDDIVTASAENGFPGTCSVNGNIVTVEYPTIADDVTIWYSSYDNHWATTAFVNVPGIIPLIDQVSANTTSLSGKADTSALSGYVATSAVTSAVTSGSTSVITSGGVYNQMGGMKIVKLTQSAYDALSPNYDANTIYFIVN